MAAEEAQSPATVISALNTLERELRAPISPWDFWFSVFDLHVTGRRRQFGKAMLQAATRTSIGALTRNKLLGKKKNPSPHKVAFQRIAATLKNALEGRAIAKVTVLAVDQESAEQLAREHLRATLDVIGFFGSLIEPTARTPSVDGGAESAMKPVLTENQSGVRFWLGAPLARGPITHLNTLYAKPAVHDLRVRLVSELLKKENLTKTQKRVLTAIRWAGRAAGKARRSERFLFYLVALETLLLPPDADSELTYRLKLRAAHLLAKTVEKRELVFNRIGQLYKTRSAIVHTGSQDVSAKDLSTARRVTLSALLVVLQRLGRVPDLEAWFLKQTLK